MTSKDKKFSMFYNATGDFDQICSSYFLSGWFKAYNFGLQYKLAPKFSTWFTFGKTGYNGKGGDEAKAGSVSIQPIIISSFLVIISR